MSALMVGISCFVCGVVASETVRRLWAKYVSPKIAELEAKAKASL